MEATSRESERERERFVDSEFFYATDEGSVLDPQTWREHWRNLLDIKKMGSEVDKFFNYMNWHLSTNCERSSQIISYTHIHSKTYTYIHISVHAYRISLGRLMNYTLIEIPASPDRRSKRYVSRVFHRLTVFRLLH